MIDVYVFDGAPGHPAKKGLIGVLNDRHTALLLHVYEPRSAIVECARQHHTDHPASVRLRCRAKQGIDRWSSVVLFRTLHQTDVSAFD